MHNKYNVLFLLAALFNNIFEIAKYKFDVNMINFKMVNLEWRKIL